MTKTLPFGAPPHRRRYLWRASVFVLLGFVASSCVLDSDDLCGPNQVIWGDDERCVCIEGTAYTPEGCVTCGANEVPSPGGCLCAMGFVRAAAGQPCQEIPAGIGQSCTNDAGCLNPEYPHCELSEGPGFCTSVGCTSRADCPSGYVCNTEANPTYCRPPVGAGRPCTMPQDCAGTDAIFCDTFVSGTCLVQDCDLATNDCHQGTECCDVSAFGLPNLCVAQGACQP